LTEKLRVLFSGRIWKMGSSIVFPLPKMLREALNAKPDDLVIMRVHPPYVTFRVAIPEATIPVERFEREDLPPSWPGKDDNVHAEETVCPHRD
jgi:antitoxin component of MazEF toxin-antitoxin module